MKILLLITTFFIFNSFSFASELLTYTLKSNKTYSYCIDDSYISNNKIYFLKSSKNRFTNKNLSTIKTYSIKAGYIYKNQDCYISDLVTSDFKASANKDLTYNNLTVLGLSNNDFNLMMALSGIFISFLFLFGLFRWI